VNASRSFTFGAMLGIALVAAAPSAVAGPCVPDPGRKPILVSVGASGQPEVEPDEVHACVGEELRWVFKGSVAREFSVLFKSVAESPFDWDRQTGSTVVGTVKGTAVKDEKSTEYKYDVEVDGKLLDPTIIVDP